MLDFLTRCGCHLCDDALARVRDVGVDVNVIDIDLDLALLAAFDHRVPVIRDPATGAVVAEGIITDADVASLRD